jgi:hypothetical protein
MIEFEVNSETQRVRGFADRVDPLLRDFVNDVAEEVRQQALDFAPVGDSGILSNHGVVRSQANKRIGGYYTAEVTLNRQVEYAKWVHDGTGTYGPKRRRITPKNSRFFVFEGRNMKTRRVRSIEGQESNPFLTKAFEYVNNVYTPARLSELRLALSAVT